MWLGLFVSETPDGETRVLTEIHLPVQHAESTTKIGRKVRVVVGLAQLGLFK